MFVIIITTHINHHLDKKTNLRSSRNYKFVSNIKSKLIRLSSWTLEEILTSFVFLIFGYFWLYVRLLVSTGIDLPYGRTTLLDTGNMNLSGSVCMYVFFLLF